MSVLSEIDSLIESLDHNHSLLEAVQEEKPELLEEASDVFAVITDALLNLRQKFESENVDMEALASLASELDWSDDPQLQKLAFSLDQLMLVLSGAPKELIAQAAETTKNYEFLYANKEKKLKDIEKILKDKLKPYRSMQAPLSTRYCPDHPGEGLTRVDDDVYQCLLDKRKYDFKRGYTTLKGNKIPGGDVAEQTKMDSMISPMVPTKTRN